MLNLFRKPQSTPQTPSLPSATDRLRGGLNNVTLANGHITFHGWVLHPDHPIDEVTISLCGQPLPPQKPVQRDDVAKVFRTIPHAGLSGIEVNAPLGPWANRDVITIDVEARQNGRIVGRYLGQHLTAKLPLKFPPAHLMKRVSGTTDHFEFSQVGLQVAFDLMNTAEKFHPGITLSDGPARRLLDYGCGCGRVAQFLMHFWPHLNYSGCDIDAEAVAWCNANLNLNAFQAMPTTGPLPFPDASFDLIVGVSVMTHLTRPEQHRWLAELRRALKPGGLCLLSTQGLRVATFNPGIAPVAAKVMNEGIVDRFADSALDGVAPPGYYRSTLQSPAFTRQEWAAYFTVQEVLEAGLDGYQDLVVLSRPQ
jgi:SAM-dependent methyltransferase